MPEFWQSSNYDFLERNGEGRLKVTPAYLAGFLERPELAPIPESCPNELALHAALRADPMRDVTEAELGGLIDADARENYRIYLAFRDLLISQGTLEGAYMSFFRAEGPRLPSLFLDALAQAILINILDGVADPIGVRAAELLFRSQKIYIQEGNILLGDALTVDDFASTGGFGNLGKLLAQAETPMRQAEMDVLTEQNAEIYWDRSDRFDTVLDLTFGRPGLDALCRVLEGWVKHFLDTDVRIHPVQSIRDERWSWHVGLDTDSSALFNDLYMGAAGDGEEVGEDRLRQLLSLFRLEFRDPAAMLSQVAGKPVYLGLAMSGDGYLRMKPQNLLVNLPLPQES